MVLQARSPPYDAGDDITLSESGYLKMPAPN